MWGTFEQRVFEGDLAQNIYYVSGGEIRNAKKVTIDPYCAWFLGPNIDTLTGKTIRFVIDGEDDTPTAITLPATVPGVTPLDTTTTYTLMGTKAPAGYRGIVIQNGKKVVRR